MLSCSASEVRCANVEDACKVVDRYFGKIILCRVALPVSGSVEVRFYDCHNKIFLLRYFLLISISIMQTAFVAKLVNGGYFCVCVDSPPPCRSPPVI